MAKDILFYLSYGHGQNGDPGAVSGRFVEREIAEKIMTACYKSLLKVENRTFKVAYPEKDGRGRHLSEHASDIAKYSEKYRVVSVDGHLNAGGGDGCEVWVHRSGSKKRLGTVLGKFILDEFKGIGQNSRGIKYSKDLYFLNTAKGIPVLPEFGFVDNIKDRKLFDTDRECEVMGQALARALVKYWKKYR